MAGIHDEEIRFQALFVAGVVLAELHRPDGMLSPRLCAN